MQVQSKDVKNGEIKKQSRKYLKLYLFWMRVKKNKLTLFGMFLMISLIILAIFAGMLVDYKEDVIKQNPKERLKLPGDKYIFGTDAYGRDIFSRLIYGSRFSISIGFISVILALLVGGFIGAVTGYFGGVIDNLLMRLTDIFLAIPGVVMVIAIVATLGSGYKNVIVAMALSSMPLFARLTRATVLSAKESEYIEAARAINVNNTRIILKHILPNSIGPIIVQATFSVATVILETAAISFLGIGIQPPLPEWGAMLSEGREYIRYYPHLIIFPGIAIALVVLSLNLTGDGLRDVLDPRLK